MQTVENISTEDLQSYVFRLADNALILGQQVSAWCGHAPALEEDIAFANVALDLIGQATNWLNYAAELDAKDVTADDLAFLRDKEAFRNSLLVEQPNADFGASLMRQFLFDSYHYFLLNELVKSTNSRIAEIAAKSVKEVTYHLERTSDLIIRLGDGSKESHQYMQRALDALWGFTAELTTADDLDKKMHKAGIGADLNSLSKNVSTHMKEVFSRANLTPPQTQEMLSGGKSGRHSDYMGELLDEMQSLRRNHPNASW